jgi:hypothetical protein
MAEIYIESGLCNIGLTFDEVEYIYGILSKKTMFNTMEEAQQHVCVYNKMEAAVSLIDTPAPCCPIKVLDAVFYLESGSGGVR